MQAAETNPRSLSREERIGLLLLLLLAAALRLLWWHLGPRVIESEGVYYARVAENLAAGRGLIGLDELGLQLLYPPLYAALIASGIRLGLAAETAGRAVSLLSGIGLPLVSFWYARRYLGGAAGWFAGLLAALHPLLIVLSAAVLTESTYLTLVLAALYFMVEVLRLGRPRAAVMAGVFLGLAYLLRPEAFVLTFLLVLVLMTLNLRRYRVAAARAGVLLAVFAVFALPYIGFLWKQTGQLRFEAKTAEGLLMAEKNIPAGQFRFGIDSNLVETGVSNTSDLSQLQGAHAPLGHTLHLLAHEAVRNVPHLLHGLADAQLGSPLLLVLAALGLFALPWDRARLTSEAPLWTATGLTLLTYTTWPFSHDRFLFPVMPALLIWAGAGLAYLRGWTRASLAGLRVAARLAPILMTCVLAIPIGLTAAYAALGVRWSDELNQSWNDPQLQDDEVLGRWLRGQGHPVRIMDTGPTVAFYAGDVLVTYPWTDADTALRYIAHKDVTFLILRDGEDKSRPYFEDWLRSPPGGNFELVLNFAGASGVSHVYRWRAAPPAAGGGQ